MKKNRLIFVVLLVAIAFVSCEQKTEQGDIVISGELPSMAGNQLYLEELEVRKREMIDSVQIGDDGAFSFSFPAGEAGFYILGTSEQNQMILQADPPATIRVTSPHKSFDAGYEVAGSEGSELLQKFETVMQARKEKIDSLAEVYYHYRGSEEFLDKKKELDSAYDALMQQHKKYIEQFLRFHPGDLASLIVINRRLGNVSVLDEEKDFRLFHLTDSALTANYPGNKHVKDHRRRVKEIRLRIFDRAVSEEKVLPGKRAPDIVLNDTAGNPFSLKSYLGHPVIIYFWAGWNAKSREDNRELTALYNKLKQDGVEILGVSLDENAVVWKGAVKLDSLQWKQVSDLSGLHSGIKKDYNLPDELPYYYLLDSDHTILYKNNHLDSLLIQLDALIL